MTIQTMLADSLDALLPQTQCTRCGYPTCRAYAKAIANDEADIDRCPPGGEDGIVALARLLGRAPKPLDPDYGIEQAPRVALIDEDVCIGCTKCIQACPVDAIVGAAKRMHAIIASECTGCELCLPPCPVDCIALVPIAQQPLQRVHVLARASLARERFESRNRRRAGAGRSTAAAARAASAGGKTTAAASSAAMLAMTPADVIAAEAPLTEITSSVDAPNAAAGSLSPDAPTAAARPI
ncbi:MAG TPA: RnfABCDGE type electron transport complex subunit B, partial [Dokdonella sp.]